MCTVLLHQGPVGAYTAAVGLNRDEFFDRPALPPQWWNAERFVAPLDLQAGGTWFGIGEQGLFVALTNGRQPGAYRAERSRGELVAGALSCLHLPLAVDWLTSLDPLAFRPCHLLLVQSGLASYIAADGDRFRAVAVEPGIHALTNEGINLGDVHPLTLARLRPLTAADSRGGRVKATDFSTAGAIVGVFRRALADHRRGAPRCKHFKTRGTRSSAVVLLGDSLDSSTLYFADGSPCRTDYSPVDFITLCAGT